MNGHGSIILKQNKWVKLAIWIIAFEGAGFLLGIITKTNLDSWYVALNKSALTPPGFVFSIIWSILYALLAIVGWSLWENRNNHKIRQLIYIYFAQIVMNWSWTSLFFQLHWLGFSFLLIICMLCLNAILIVGLKNEKKELTIALIPYVLWLTFAAYLNGVIWILN